MEILSFRRNELPLKTSNEALNESSSSEALIPVPLIAKLCINLEGVIEVSKAELLRLNAFESSLGQGNLAPYQKNYLVSNYSYNWKLIIESNMLLAKTSQLQNKTLDYIRRIQSIRSTLFSADPKKLCE